MSIRNHARINHANANANRLPRLEIADGTIEGLKWLALVLMVLDHVNKYLLHDSVPVMFAAGRLSMPLFGFVLAYNLARPGTLANGVYLRLIKRLIMTGAVASLPFIALGGLLAGWWPLNIIVTLLTAVSIMYLTEKGGKMSVALAVILFFIGGGLVEFWWFALVICLAAWRYCKTPSWSALITWIVATAALYLINRDLWALAAFPIVFLTPYLPLKIPRLRMAFYAFYPIHLAAIWAVARQF